MFVKKLVEKASLKKPGGYLDGLKSEDVNPRLVFHYGIPSGSFLLAYDSIQKILAISTKVLIIYTDGCITLWAIQESKAVFKTGGTMLQSVNHETKKVTAACWACPFGSKVVVGCSNGDIFIWSIPSSSNYETELDFCTSQSAPIHKLNLGYKLDKIPIASLKWVYADGKASRLYVMGSLQVVLINEQIGSRTAKLGLYPPEPCVDMTIISSSIEQSKHSLDSFLLLGKSGHIYVYDDCVIEKYLLQSQSRSPQSLPKEVMVTAVCRFKHHHSKIHN